MEIIDLVSHIKEGRFLEYTNFSYDLIVWENMPADLPKGKEEHIGLGDISYDFGIAGKMAARSETSKKLLLIIETVNVLYLLPWISSLEDKKKCDDSHTWRRYCIVYE